MDLSEILKEIRNIEPDKNFSENSRRVVLAQLPAGPLSPRRILARSIAVASSVALAGALIFIIAGGLSATKLAPKFSSIDPAALRAEAQAIDTQINLLNVDYAENAVSTKSAPTVRKNAPVAIFKNSSSTSVATPTSTATATSTLSVDEILQGLSQ